MGLVVPQSVWVLTEYNFAGEIESVLGVYDSIEIIKEQYPDIEWEYRKVSPIQPQPEYHSGSYAAKLYFVKKGV